MSKSFAHGMTSLCIGAALMSVAALAAAQDEGEDEAAAPEATAAPDAAATAPEGSMPLQYVQRGMTLPSMMLAPEAGFSVFKFPVIDPFIGLGLGASFGITDDLEIGATLVPLLLSPSVEYGNPSVGATYRFMTGEFEMGARVRFYIPARSGSDPALLAGVPMLLRIGDSMRLDTGVNFGFGFGSDVTVGMFGVSGLLGIEPGIPLRLSVQVSDPFYFQASTGFGILTFEAAGDTMFIPLGVGAGYTIANDDNTPFIDITANFDFPLLFTPGSSGDAVNPDSFAIGLAGRGYFQL